MLEQVLQCSRQGKRLPRDAGHGARHQRLGPQRILRVFPEMIRQICATHGDRRPDPLGLPWSLRLFYRFCHAGVGRTALRTCRPGESDRRIPAGLVHYRRREPLQTRGTSAAVGRASGTGPQIRTGLHPRKAVSAGERPLSSNSNLPRRLEFSPSKVGHRCRSPHRKYWCRQRRPR